MTTTVESIFGSGRMVDGFFLNNQMTDFAFSPLDAQGRPAANAVTPGKRPRSSMVPTILLTRDGRFAGAIGSAGGNAILAYVAKTLVAAIDWGGTMQGAISALEGEIPEEFPLLDLQEAASAMQEITGQRTTDDLLHHIFARFCIGK